MNGFDPELIKFYMNNICAVPILILDEDDNITFSNYAFHKTFVNIDDVRGKNAYKLLNISVTEQREVNGKNHHLFKGKDFKCKYTLVDGHTIYLSGSIYSNDTQSILSIRLYKDYECDIIERLTKINLEMSTMTKDLSIKNKEITEATSEIIQLLDTDYMTNIGNRRYFYNHLEEAVSRCNRYKKYDIAIIMMDINDFKSINDTYGHDVGDVALMSFVQAIETSIRKEDIFSRIGGDEFAILFQHKNRKNIKLFMGKLKQAISKAKVGNTDLVLSASMGYAIYSNKDNLYSLIKRADQYLYDDKDKYKKQKREQST